MPCASLFAMLSPRRVCSPGYVEVCRLKHRQCVNSKLSQIRPFRHHHHAVLTIIRGLLRSSLPAPSHLSATVAYTCWSYPSHRPHIQLGFDSSLIPREVLRWFLQFTLVRLCYMTVTLGLYIVCSLTGPHTGWSQTQRQRRGLDASVAQYHQASPLWSV